MNIRGITAFGYLCVGNLRAGAADSMPLFRYLASSNQLDDLAADDTPASFKFHSYLLPAIEYARLSVPGLFNLISTSCGDDKPQLSWTSINWNLVRPEVVAELVDKRQTISLREFQSGQCAKGEQSMVNFIVRYFCYGHRRKLFPLTLNARFEQFRALCRRAFKGASLEDLTRTSKRYGNTTPLMTLVYRITFDSFTEIKERRRIFLGTFRFFLQDLKACGIDLEEYGRNEWHAWRYSNSPWEHTRVFTSAGRRGPRLASFSYGPEPKDWSFELDYFTPEYARDFWVMLEAPPPPPPMPGAWVEDD